MKFTKEDAYKELVKQMTTNGETLNLSSRSINEQIEKLLPLLANDETELDNFITNTLPLFKTMDANVRNDVSGGIKKYKDENPIQTQQKQSNGGNTELAEMRERLEKMESEYKSRQEAERIANTRNEIVEKLKAKGVKDTSWLTPFLSDITITEDFDVDAKVETYLKSYNTFKAQIDTDVTPKGAGGNNLKDDDTIKRAAEIAKQNRLVGENE